MKIKQYQSGGGISYIPTVNRIGAENTSASTSKNKTEDNQLSKATIDLLEEKGIQIDVSTYIDSVNSKLSMMFGSDLNNLRSTDLLWMTNQVNIINQNAKLFEDAKQVVERENIGREVATDSRGRLYVQKSNGQIGLLTPEEYLKNKKDTTILTVDDLLYLRQTSPQFAYNERVLQDITHSVGIPTILKYVADVIKNFKTTDITGYGVKKQESIRKGMDHIADGDVASAIVAGPDGVYKISTKQTIVDSGIENALNYLINTLPNNYKHLLTAKAAAENYKPEALLAQMLVANTGRTLETSYDETASKASIIGGTEDSKSLQDTSLAERYATGQGFAPASLINFSVNGDTNQMWLMGQDVGPMYIDEGMKPGKPMSVASLAQILDDGYGIKGITDYSSITFGNQTVNEEKISGLVYTGSTMHRVSMPAKIDERGKIVPDFEIANKIDNIVKNGLEKKFDVGTINRNLDEVCKGARYDAERKVVILPENKSRIFLTFQAVGGDRILDITANNKYFGDGEDFDEETYVTAIKYGYANHDKNARARVAGGDKRGWWDSMWGLVGNLYKANVWIPMRESITVNGIYGHEYLPKSAYMNTTQQAAENNRTSQIREDFETGNRQTTWQTR